MTQGKVFGVILRLIINNAPDDTRSQRDDSTDGERELLA
jgi:hypothetical protein